MFLKNLNFSSKIKRSKVTDYAALIYQTIWGKAIIAFFTNEHRKFSNTGARMLDTIYHMTLELF